MVATLNAIGLGRGDHCLNVMPLFHINDLVAAVLASLSAGASVAFPVLTLRAFLPGF